MTGCLIGLVWFGLISCLLSQAIDSNKRGSFGSLQASQLVLDALSQRLLAARKLLQQRVRVLVPHRFVRCDQFEQRERRRFDEERDERVYHFPLIDSLRGSQQEPNWLDGVRFVLIAAQPVHDPIEQIIVQISLRSASHEAAESDFDALAKRRHSAIGDECKPKIAVVDLIQRDGVENEEEDLLNGRIAL